LEWNFFLYPAKSKTKSQLKNDTRFLVLD
jgi:hypothetical protein